MHHRMMSALAMLLFLVWSCSSEIEPDQKNAAIEAAGQWLLMVDDKAYEESWHLSAEFLKTSVSREQWMAAMDQLRTPLGKPLSRKMTHAEYRTMLPKALKGEYLIIKYETTFEGKPPVRESVTQMLADDGSWRVGGYQLK